jgi:hypothetical protein
MEYEICKFITLKCKLESQMFYNISHRVDWKCREGENGMIGWQRSAIQSASPDTLSFHHFLKTIQKLLWIQK